MTDANGWQPIETAPREGARVLVWEGGEFASIAKRDERHHTGWSDDEGLSAYPTHWQPLPGAPEVVG